MDKKVGELDPGRRDKDRDTEIAFRRLKTWAELVDDADWRYLEDVAATGVPLGVPEEKSLMSRPSMRRRTRKDQTTIYRRPGQTSDRGRS